MAEFELTMSPEGRIFLKEELRKTLGMDESTRQVRAIVNSKSVLLLPVGLSIEDAVRCLEILKADLELQRQWTPTPSAESV